MKKILLTGIITLALGHVVTGQLCPPASQESAVSKKPSEAAISSVSCNRLMLQWKGNTGQDYTLSITIKNAAGKIIQSNAPATITHDGLNYTASVAATAGAKINWSVLGISKIHGRVFYSYPLRGKDFIVPSCSNISAAKTASEEKNTAAIKSKNMLYPNPAQSILNITLAGNTNVDKNIMVYNAYGSTVLTKRSNQNNIQLNVASLAAGTYFVKITDAAGKEIFSSRFIKMP